MGQLYYGDNLYVLRESIKDESVDLIYLDPPFNSKRDYNLLFKSPKGVTSEAQIEAFEDTWHWNEQAEREFDEIIHGKNTDLARMMTAMRSFLGENDMMAYLTMMANRLIELHRVLKTTGSLYLHCDPTASHYLKIVLDAVFGKEFFLSEVVWKRTSSHNSANRYGPSHDIIFFYSKTEDFVWNPLFGEYDQTYVDAFFTHIDEKGRRWRRTDLTGPGVRKGDSGKPWKGYDPTARNRHWQPASYFYDKYKELSNGDDLAKYDLLTRFDKLESVGLIHWPERAGGMPQGRRLLEDALGTPLQDVWTDVKIMHNLAEERLGYPTQKPLALLERIISASSNEGDVVLDPFCGCGTAVHAAQKLKRDWIGIDITHLAISLIEKRLKDAFGEACKFDVHGTPKDLDSARDLAHRDKYQFQWWAVSLVEAQPFQGKKKGADGDIDGIKYFRDIDRKEARKIVVSVKGGGLKADDVRALNHVREREGAEIGLFISLEQPTAGMVKDAASAGLYTSGNEKMKVPRIQLLTIDGLLSGTQRAQHPDYLPDMNFKKAGKESNAQQKELL